MNIRTTVAAAALAPRGKNQHAASVFKGGALLSVATNTHKKHAEVAALEKISTSGRKCLTIVSVRVTRAGLLRNARPCASCQQYMSEVGVHTIHYSTDSGTMEMMRL